MVIIDVKKRKPHLASNRCPVICLRHMFTALSNWRFFPASSIRVFSSRVYTRVRARGRRRSSSLSLCVERHPRLWMCVCPHLLASSYVRPGAGTRVDIFTERRRIYGVECPNFFIFASLSLNNVVVGVRVDVFLFFVCQVSKAFLYFQKGQNTRFRVQSHSRTRALWTTTTPHGIIIIIIISRRRRRLLRGRSKLSKPGDRSMNIYEQRVGGQKNRVGVYVFQKLCTKKKNI